MASGTSPLTSAFQPPRAVTVNACFLGPRLWELSLQPEAAQTHTLPRCPR